MKKLLLTIGLFTIGTSALFAQKYMSRTGKISFNASSPSSPEKIEAVNNEVGTVLDAQNGELVFQVLVKSFKFEKALMQEHFNENYMESDKYPKAEFKGNIANLNEINFKKDGTYNVKVAGKLTLHGVTHDLNVPGTATVKGNTVTLKGKFSVGLHDYKIDIPSVVADKVGKEATITMESELAQR